MRPHREVSVDEAMVPFKGRSSLKQYMPQKPVKRGFKVWCRADAHNVYISQIQVYAGKASDGTVEKNLGKRIVEDLTVPLTNKGYFIFFDNFFSSVSLAESLLSKNLFCIGTAKTDRINWPSTLANIKEMTKKWNEGIIKRLNQVV